MQAIFLCETKENPMRVFADATIRKICASVETEPTVYTKADVLRDKARFADTAYIFSTWGMPTFTEEEIAACFPALQAVFYAAGTVQSFARPFLRRGVKVFSAWAANAVPVAEYTVAQIILANKGFFAVCGFQSRAAHKEARKAFSCYGGNFDATVGIIGAGMIGSLVIEMLRPYRVRVMVFDPFLSDKRAGELDVEKVSLPTLFASCTVVSNHLANNAETRGMLNGALFAVMPPNATFINTGRGAQVVEADLIRVLRARRDLIALLDVTAPEPPLDDSELYSLPNCILTPHIAGSSGKEVHRMSEYMYAEFEKLLRGAPTSYEVTEAMLKTMA